MCKPQRLVRTLSGSDYNKLDETCESTTKIVIHKVLIDSDGGGYGVRYAIRFPSAARLYTRSLIHPLARDYIRGR